MAQLVPAGLPILLAIRLPGQEGLMVPLDLPPLSATDLPGPQNPEVLLDPPDQWAPGPLDLSGQADQLGQPGLLAMTPSGPLRLEDPPDPEDLRATDLSDLSDLSDPPGQPDQIPADLPDLPDLFRPNHLLDRGSQPDQWGQETRGKRVLARPLVRPSL